MDIHMEEYKQFQDDIKAGLFSEEGKPLKCRKCGHKAFKEHITDQVGLTVMECDERCAVCDTFAAHWAYGQYEMPTP